MRSAVYTSSRQLKHYIIAERRSARGRGKCVRLSEAGMKTQHNYHRLTREIEDRWLECFNGAAEELREALTALLKRSELSEGPKPPPDTTRAGAQTPALGRRDIGPAARQRMRDLVSQSEGFVRDPAGLYRITRSWT